VSLQIIDVQSLTDHIKQAGVEVRQTTFVWQVEVICQQSGFDSFRAQTTHGTQHLSMDTQASKHLGQVISELGKVNGPADLHTSTTV